jgi:hypothetical protein
MARMRQGSNGGQSGWTPLPPDERANRRAWYLAILTFLLLVTLVITAVIYRLSVRHRERATAATPPSDWMPQYLESDNSPEANAFRSTCSRCHSLPDPAAHDELGWGQVRGRMAAQMSARNMQIPNDQLDLAMAYAIRHSRPPAPPPASRPS